MSLYVVATPIGNPEDLSLRARRLLQEADLIIVEEAKEARRLLKSLDLPLKPMKELNEHSRKEDLSELIEDCKNSNVALISDCGTPAFCDPGADLVKACRQNGVTVHSAPGPSSLMTFLSLLGERLDQFYFRGFLPAKTELRVEALREIKQKRQNTILMDTPYRMIKLLNELKDQLGDPQIILGIELSMENEAIYSGKVSKVLKELKSEKAEFVLLLKP